MSKITNKPRISKRVARLVSYGTFMEYECVSKVVNVGVMVTID